jgi:Ca2+-transporting ATPase
MNYLMKKVLKYWRIKCNSSNGLSALEAKNRLEKYGSKEFTKQEKGSLWDDIKESLTEPMMVILLAAALISALIGEVHDAFGIVCAVALGITIGIVTEGKSQ